MTSYLVDLAEIPRLQPDSTLCLRFQHCNIEKDSGDLHEKESQVFSPLHSHVHLIEFSPFSLL